MKPSIRRRRGAPTRDDGILIAATSLGFAAVAVGVATGATRDADRRVRRAVAPRRRPRVTSAADAISTVAGPHAHPAIAAMLSVALSLRQRRIVAGPLLASIGATAIDKGVRLVIRQRRPPRAGHHHGLDRYAFPSGHTCASTAIVVATACEIARDVPRARHVAWGVAVSVSALVAWSRLYLDEHWIDDIAGGWLAGIAVGHAADLASRG